LGPAKKVLDRQVGDKLVRIFLEVGEKFQNLQPDDLSDTKHCVETEKTVSGFGNRVARWFF
jgi:hypothetical protein